MPASQRVQSQFHSQWIPGMDERRIFGPRSRYGYIDDRKLSLATHMETNASVCIHPERIAQSRFSRCLVVKANPHLIGIQCRLNNCPPIGHRLTSTCGNCKMSTRRTGKIPSPLTDTAGYSSAPDPPEFSRP